MFVFMPLREFIIPSEFVGLVIGGCPLLKVLICSIWQYNPRAQPVLDEKEEN